MLVPNQTVTVKWSSRNWKHFIAKGYDFTAFGDELTIKAEDLMPKSSVRVLFYCDYCGKEHYKQMSSHSNKENGLDCCAKCARIEQKKTCLKLYGVESKTMLPETQKKMQDNCEKNYGNRFPSQVESIKQKRVESFVKKYGTDSPFKSEEVWNKIKKTNLERYGTEYPSQSDTIKQKIKNNNIEKYGVPSPSMLEENKIKMMQTFYKNGKVPTSKIEIRFCEKLEELYGKQNVTRGFVFDWAAFDCLLEIDGTRIDCEWDGEYWHRYRTNQDEKRNKYLSHRGFKVLRFVSNHAFPTDEQIVKAVQELVDSEETVKYVKLDV